MLRTVRTVIVDEIHAVIGSRRGAHVALSLERLQHVAREPLRSASDCRRRRSRSTTSRGFSSARRTSAPRGGRIAQSWTKDTAAQWSSPSSFPGALEAVMSGETWVEIYDRLAALVREHRTTLIFTNTRRLAERVTRHLSERLACRAWSRRTTGAWRRRCGATRRSASKAGKLRALLATASLELGIDIGTVDRLSSSARPGESRRFSSAWDAPVTIRGACPGAAVPLTRDELVECVALLRAVRQGELDHVVIPEKPLDVLAQQIVAEAAARTGRSTRTTIWCAGVPVSDAERSEFDSVLTMLAQGIAARRGRMGAPGWSHAVNGRIRGRRGAPLLAITSGGAIPDTADYRAMLEPEGVKVGTLNEDFAIESQAGDIFQLGNTSWRILRVQAGVVRVEDARGQPPTILPGSVRRASDELSAAVAQLRKDLEARLGDRDAREWLVSS